MTPLRIAIVGGGQIGKRHLKVLVEKPIADGLAHAKTLVSAAKTANVPLLTGHHRRHHPIMGTAAQAIREGAVSPFLRWNCVAMNPGRDGVIR